MKKWLCDLSTGLFTGRSMDAPEDILEANLKEGFFWMHDVMDWESQRVDMDVFAIIAQAETDLLAAKDEAERETIRKSIDTLRLGLIVDYQPPPPSDDHEWIPELKRYRLKPDVAAAQQRRAVAVNQIERLELASLRSLRELRVAEVDGKPRPADAAAKLKQIEAEIEALRPDLGASVSAGRS